MSRSEMSLRGLIALRALQAHGTHEAAARSLGLTRSALSHRIAEIERSLGATLVVKKGRASALTEDGLALIAATHSALAALDAAIDPFLRRRHELRLTTVNTFAANWLMPRLAAFQRQHPNIDLTVATSQDVVDLDNADFDCAIRYGLGSWPGVDAKLIFRETLTPANSADCVAVPEAYWSIIRARTRPGDWRTWWGATNQIAPLPSRGLVVQNRAQALDAALAGAGVALTDYRYLEPHIAAGRLRAVGPTIHLDEGYFLVRRARSRRSIQIDALEQWLIQSAVASH